MEDNKEKYSVRAINLSGYEVPTITEVYNKDWVAFGDANDYFDDIIEKYLGSPTNSRCINGISDMISGRGLDSFDSEDRPKEYLEMKRLLPKRQIKRIAFDYKLLGQAAVQVSYNKAKTKILKISHFPMETLRAEKADKSGIIKAWYYHPKWKEYKNSDKPKRIPSFSFGKKTERNEIYVIKPYRSGFYYYVPTNYHGCLQYCSLEEEVSNYHLNNIKNGLQPSLLINFNNGVPDKEKQDEMEKLIYRKFSGTSNAGKFILAFNESLETKADLEPIHLPDAHAQYQFMSDEAREKIMLGHGIVSPILLGIKDNTGFGNNAEELRTASVLMDNVIIRPMQDELINAFEEILSFNNINIRLYFVTLQPIEFTELDNISTKIKREEETGEKLSSDYIDLTEDDEDDLLSQLDGFGETISDEWELIHSEKLKDVKNALNQSELAEANPYKKSKEDNGVYKVRYAYMPVRNSADTRRFCKHMEGYTSNNVVFRKEDINMMSFRGVNRELGHNKQNYSLLKFKGGKNCHHWWEMRVYKKIGGKEIQPKADFVEPNNPSEIDERMIDRIDKGAYRNK